MPEKDVVSKRQLWEMITQGILSLLEEIPISSEEVAEDPLARSRLIVEIAAAKSAVVSGAAALPPPPINWLTVVPDILVVWKIEAQMVADIAACFGKSDRLTPEVMLFTLFKHSMAQALRDLGVRVGTKVLVKRATVASLQKIAGKIGLKVTQKLLLRVVARALWILGLAAVAAYAAWDTHQIGMTAINIFSKDMEVDSDTTSEADPLSDTPPETDPFQPNGDKRRVTRVM